MSFSEDNRQLKQSYQASEVIMQDRATSFYQAFQLLPKERFQAVAAVYAFCRFADDIADSGRRDPESRIKDLARIRVDLVGFYSTGIIPSGEKDHIWWPALADTITRYNIPIDGFLNQIEGQRSDLLFEEFPDLPSLIRYAELVAGSVGMLLTPILMESDVKVEQTACMKACESLGVAMQLTNILRDVGEDIRERNRIYLPLNLLREYGVKKETLYELATAIGEPAIPLPFISLWEFLAVEADALYGKIIPFLSAFLEESRFPLLASSYLYHSIQETIRESGYNCFTRRNYTDERIRADLVRKALVDSKRITEDITSQE